MLEMIDKVYKKEYRDKSSESNALNVDKETNRYFEFETFFELCKLKKRERKELSVVIINLKQKNEASNNPVPLEEMLNIEKASQIFNVLCYCII